MRRSFVAVAVALFGVSAIGTMAPALATKPDPGGEHKVWVCHATAGEGELKNGYNLIYVGVASTQPNGSYHGENDHYGHAHTRPKDNSKYGLLYDYLDVDPTNLPGKCGRPEAPSKEPVEALIGSVADCDTKTVTETYQVTEYTYTWNDGEWVESETITEKVVTRAMTPQEVAACPTPGEPPSKEPVEALIGSVADCDTKTVTETYQVTEYTYTWDGGEWVESETITEKVVTRAMTPQEVAACPTPGVPPPPMPPMPSKEPVETLIGTDENCEAMTVTETYSVTEYSYTWNGAVWVESETTTEELRSRNMTEEEAAACPTQESKGPVPPVPPTVVDPPAGVTPVVDTPTGEVPQAPVAGTPVAEASPVTGAPTALPQTGSETWTIFLIGLVTLLAGAGLVVLSHRSA